MIIVCGHCDILVGCIDDVSNKTETCKNCSDQSFCLPEISGKHINGLCYECAVKEYGERYE